MTLTLAQNTLLAILLASVRAAAWLSVCPPFNGRGLPSQAKGLISVAIALPVAPKLATQLPAEISARTLIVDVFAQVLVGGALGFATHLLIAAVESAGSLIDLFGGFAVAFAFDPFSYTGNAVFGRFYGLLATALLLATDAYQIILLGFTRSYQVLPLNRALSVDRFQRLLTHDLNEMFLAALQISGPLLAVLFLTDLVLGLLSRVAPSLNAFGLGFPAKILLTLVFAAPVLVLVPDGVRNLAAKSVTTVLSLLGQ